MRRCRGLRELRRAVCGRIRRLNPSSLPIIHMSNNQVSIFSLDRSTHRFRYAVEVCRGVETCGAHRCKLLNTPHALRTGSLALGHGYTHFLEAFVIVDAVHGLLVIDDFVVVNFSALGEHTATRDRFDLRLARLLK